ncbi:MAG TPA: GNAT family N-acetyltransferase [Pseudomonas sp.]|nr:GNAT family N-acetyltransferase [Pseudomonas sp.]
MQEQDIAAVLAIQSEAYRCDLLESEAVIRARRASAPRHAWVAVDDEGVCAYLFAYHSRVGKVTPLDGDFRIPARPDCLYLHDLAVARRATGRRIGPALVGEALGQARRQRLPFSALVSVQDSNAFWRRLGYSPRRPDPEHAEHLDSYQVPATYMVRALQ